MKTLMLLAAICLVLCVVLPQSDAQCSLVRITRCYLVLQNGNLYRICVVSYHLVCGSGKRDQIEEDKGRTPTKGTEKAFFEKFPNKLSTYDKDGDNSISFDEFRTTLGDVHDLKMLRKAFARIDKNGDNAISCAEFVQAKLDFSHKPVC